MNLMLGVRQFKAAGWLKLNWTVSLILTPVCKPYKIHLEEIKNMQLFLIRHSPVPRHQIFSVCPVALSKNRVWTLSL